MPTMKLRTRVRHENTEIRRDTAPQEGNGTQSFDGRKNTNAGSTVSPVPQSLAKDPRIVRTYGS